MIRAGLVLLLRIYQAILSPLMPAACRFEPTCSAYAVEAVQRHGPIKGLWLAVQRLGRCRPGGGGGHDPVP
ncbi:MAG: membrane protein insertion efficiency factor YidD [Planctomycetota bacterium]|nr:membrane protein insertion efficiency factor YidD [Planctomycetota bacterium]